MADVRLEVTDAIGRRVVRVDTPLFTIGRRSKSHLCLVGTDVSRDHAEIVCDGDRFILRDHQSRYGTFVNDQAIVELAALIAYQNMSSKFNAALGVPAHGFCTVSLDRSAGGRD